MSQRIILYSDLRSQKGIGHSKTQLWRLERAGKFPCSYLQDDMAGSRPKSTDLSPSELLYATDLPSFWLNWKKAALCRGRPLQKMVFVRTTILLRAKDTVNPI